MSRWIWLLFAATSAFGHVFEVTEARISFTEAAFRLELVCDLDALALGVPFDQDNKALADHLAGLEQPQRDEIIARLETFFQRRLKLRIDEEHAPYRMILPEHQPGMYASSTEPVSYFGTTVAFEGSLPANSEQFSLFASRALPPLKLIIETATEKSEPILLGQGEHGGPWPIQRIVNLSLAQTLWRYLVLGFEHILPLGLDHILFVLGLFLLCTRTKPLLIQVTAFTLAHTVTLALATLDLVRLPSQPVEVLIALSIVYVALENVFTEEVRPHRILLVFGFGLLHGLGFAGVLSELGLPERQLLPALVAFNVGVELGQLAVILLAFALIGWFRERDWYRARVVKPVSVAIALTGLYWVIERML